MQATSSSSPLRALGVILGTALVVVGLVLLGLYGVLWWAGYNRVPVEVPSPLPFVLGDQVLFPSLVDLVPLPAEVMPEEEEPAVELEPVAAVEQAALAPAVPVPAGERIVIPRISVDSSVVNVAISGGEWPVPRFVVGHMAESAYPGEVGNAVFAGHLISLTLGNVFEHLKELRPGDEILYYGKNGRQAFRVTESRAVKNTDTSVLASKPGQALITLITCEGRWVPAENDYDQRRVVFAEPSA